MANVKVDWNMKNGEFFGTVTGYGLTIDFLTENSGCSKQKILWSTPLVQGAIRKRTIKAFETAVNEIVCDAYNSIEEMYEQERREYRAAVEAHKKRLARHLDFATITIEMREYVVAKCQELGYDVTLENFEDAIISDSPRGAFARSFLAEIDDRPGIYSKRRRCVDVDTTNLVASVANDPETIVQ